MSLQLSHARFNIVNTHGQREQTQELHSVFMQVVVVKQRAVENARVRWIRKHPKQHHTFNWEMAILVIDGRYLYLDGWSTLGTVAYAKELVHQAQLIIGDAAPCVTHY